MTCYRFDQRTLMSYRRTLRSIPRALRRQWVTQRYRFCEPRVPISRWYIATRNLR